MRENRPKFSPISNMLVQPTFHQAEYSVGTRLAYRLEEIGASHYFVVPGDFNMSLLDEVLKNASLNMVGCCNELNAGYAADGYARTSPSGVAVIVVTFTVGSLSVINAVAGAYAGRLKVIVISGCPGKKLLTHPLIHHSIGTQDRDQPLRMFQEITTACVRLDPDNDPAGVLDNTISKCLQDSLPVYIEIPADVAALPCAVPGPLPIEECPSDPNELAKAVQTFRESWELAKKPVIIVGVWARTLPTDLLIALIERLGCAVYCQPDSRSIVPETHPQYAGVFWCDVGSPECSNGVQESDLWVVVGGRWSNLHTLGQVHLDDEAYRILDIQEGHLTAPSGQVRGVSLYETVVGLVDSNISRNGSTRPPFRRASSYANQEPLWKENRPLSNKDIVQGIQEIIRPRDTLFAEAGGTWFHAQQISLPPGTAFQKQFLYASIGWSLPAALGCQLARPDGRAVLFIGDGSFQMTAQEVSTMIKMKAKVIIIIFNNLGYAIENAISVGPYNYFANWNYASFAQSMCTPAHHIDSNNPHAGQECSCDSPLIAMQVKTTQELALALTRVEQEPDKLAILDCCLHPQDFDPAMYRLSAGMVKANETVYEAKPVSGHT